MPRYCPDVEGFLAAAKEAEVVPVYRQLLSDHLTPVTAFELLGKGEHAFLLESVVGNEKIGRYSFIAASPQLVYQVKDGRARLMDHRQNGKQREFDTKDPLSDIGGLVAGKRYYRDKALPAFTGGVVGYCGYDTIRYFEGEKLPTPPADDRNLPDILVGLYETLVVFDQVDKTIKVIANAEVGNDAKAAYRDACAKIDATVARLEGPPRSKLGEIDPRGALTLKYTSNMSRERFEEAVRQGQEYIRAGDISQFVPSQRLRVKSKADPFDVYRALRIINPSPFMFYLKSPGCTLIGASPEILCRVADGQVTSRPLAGTRRRGATEAEDKQLEEELLADPKERAEHIMLVRSE